MKAMPLEMLNSQSHEWIKLFFKKMTMLKTLTKGFGQCPVELHKTIYKSFLAAFVSHFKSVLTKSKCNTSDSLAERSQILTVTKSQRERNILL